MPICLHLLTASALTLVLSTGLVQATELISRSSSGVQGNLQSRYPAISGNGRFVSFQSDASNLVAGDSNGWADVFLHDRRNGTTVRISVSPQGTQGSSFSDISSMSWDGKRIVFASFAALLPGHDYQSCYLLDRRDGSLQIINRHSNGTIGNSCASPSIDLAGARVAFSTVQGLDAGDTNGTSDVYLRDLVANTTTRISRGPAGVLANGASYSPRISGDGNRVLYASEAGNLVAGDSNGVRDLFVSDRQGGGTLRISVGPGQVQASTVTHQEGAINFDGTILAFSSDAPELPDPGEFSESTLYLRLPTLDETYPISLPTHPSLDREGFNDQPDLSATGQYLVFASTDDLLLDEDLGGGIYVVDLLEGLIARVSQRISGSGSGNHIQPRISGDGTGIVWVSNATNLVAGDGNGTWDVFFARNPLHPLIHRSDFED